VIPSAIAVLCNNDRVTSTAEPREILLSGASWTICPDPLNRGMSEKWGENPPLEDEPWHAATVPGTIQHSLGADFRGVAWYRLSTNLPDGWMDLGEYERLRVRFDSCATDARVWINGQYVGRHVGDFVPFEFEATKQMLSRDGVLEVVVRVDQMYAPRPAKGVITEHGHIGKGFHDVLSLQHAGLWGDVKIRRTGVAAIRPNGVTIHATQTQVTVKLEFAEPFDASMGLGVIKIRDSAGTVVGALGLGATHGSLEHSECLDGHHVHQLLEKWSPQSPTTYRVEIELYTRGLKQLLEAWSGTFGVRTVELGGPRNRRILLNGDPIQLRGVLHWGHEPSHIAPMPTREQVRSEFAELKLRGFNCVCLCMVYMPEHYYEIADEMGMLLWQEHPVWKAPMGDEHLPEYQRLFSEYFRRDRRHPSVILVSGSCEHEMFNEQLAAWWWGRARTELPGTLAQVQTAFFAWADPNQTDLYDEHTYDNSGRWVDYLSDVRAAIDELPQPDKPFIMGETILANAWPDVATLKEVQQRLAAENMPQHRAATFGAAPSAAPWWMTRGLEQCEALEHEISKRWGEPALFAFRRDAHRHTLNLRKFQCELLRADPANAGWVMNHIRDVPACRCGFMNDLDLWRYEPFELRSFLSDAVFLLKTPSQLRGFAAASPLHATLAVCNFSPRDIDVPARVAVRVGSKTVSAQHVQARCPRGEVAELPIVLGMFSVDRPTAVTVHVEAEGVPENEWTLWVLPHETMEANVAVYDAPRPTDEAMKPDFEERKYSSGWGLPCRTWKPRFQLSQYLAPDAVLLAPGSGAIALHQGVILTHLLTHELLHRINGGGHVVLLGSRLRGGLGAQTVMQWAGVPLIIERSDASWPIRPGERTAVLDILHHDLSKHTQRMIPTEVMGLARDVEPIIRFIHTHDSGRPTIYDAVFRVAIGDGTLTVTTLDHSTEAGRWLLARILQTAGSRVTTPPIDVSRFEQYCAPL
jgi:hypothetical protein